jgi:hypothetical protein
MALPLPSLFLFCSELSKRIDSSAEDKNNLNGVGKYE